jgi:predicted Zn-ribbon and HTH transcriptional regulator
MRSTFRHQIAERRGPRRPSRLRLIAALSVRDEGSSVEALAELRAAEASGTIVATRACELEVERVRAAGGPLDTAVYTCSCGCLFDASVSTTVRCPHCGANQAW